MNTIRSNMKKLVSALTLGAALCLSQGAIAASGEMGTGIPHWANYGSVAGNYTVIWGLASPTIAFPAGCPYLFLIPGTLGADTYKIAIATMLTAKTNGKSVRFYATVPRDGGCGVDYFEMMD